MRRVIILTIEGLGTNLVGCYGGAIAPTKHWDRLAAHSLVFDQYWADTLSAEHTLESMWSGTHYSQRMRSDASTDADSSPVWLNRALMVTDCPVVASGVALDVFEHVLLVDEIAKSEPEQWESDLSLDEESIAIADNAAAESQIAHLIESAIGKWSSDPNAFPILWIHSRGLHAEWDAPFEYRCVMCDEGDPEPPKFISPPHLEVTDKTDPDEVFGLACAAGGQAIAMDEAWELIESALEELQWSHDCLRVLAGVSGYAMGEHGWVGPSKKIYAESVHLPLVIQPGDKLPLGVRVHAMTQPNCLSQSWAAWLQGSAEASNSPDAFFANIDILFSNSLPPSQQLAFACSEDEEMLMVPAWSCRWTKDENGDETTELYAMPDDRWQQNEIALRATHIVEELTALKQAWLTTCAIEKKQWSEPLSREWIAPIR